ncbi:MAG: hypothetical protein KKC30_07670 [Proteobacteria bacterium]|nr:hypothetical protein [Pseudomonadota bacterium]MBU4382200.1 hypothetical protein [Pseudomonadota bacterium]MCG2765866.1 hypothetical protein [Desulfarculaceae bacterium]
MDPFICRAISYVVLIVGSGLVLLGTLGTWYFGNLAEKVMPFKAPIHTATTTVEITVSSPKNINTHYMDRGGYLALVKGGKPLIVLAAHESYAHQLGNNRLKFRGLFSMDVQDPAAGKPVNYLTEAERAEVFFHEWPKDGQILEGNAVCTVNSNIGFKIKVPLQKMSEGVAFINDLSGVFNEFPN